MAEIQEVKYQNNRIQFPRIELALTEPNGLLAHGGNLLPDTLIEAYKNGIFPWYSNGQPILWWSPDPRMILKPEAFHVARSFRRHLNHFSGHVTFNQDFESVITQCAAPRQGREETWITNEMKAAYIHLHRLGIAHSIEIHDQNQLIGGLYGINLGKVFFAESMFSARSGGSKLALYSLCQKLKERGGVLIDCQVYSPHLATLGAVEISRSEFIQKLRTHVHLPPCLLD